MSRTRWDSTRANGRLGPNRKAVPVGAGNALPEPDRTTSTAETRRPWAMTHPSNTPTTVTPDRGDS